MNTHSFRLKYLCFALFTVLLCAFLGSCSKELASVSPTSGIGGSLARFAIVGNYLYTVDHQSMVVFDIQDAKNPKKMDTILIGRNIETIFPRDNQTLFIGSQDGMYIYDVQNPIKPVLLSVQRHIYSCDPVVADDKYAYVTLRSTGGNCGQSVNELQIYDIQDLKAPKQIISYPMESPKGLGIASGMLFVCDAELKVFDATDVYNLKPKKTLNVKANDVMPIRDSVLVVVLDDGLHQYNYRKDMKLLSKIFIKK